MPSAEGPLPGFGNAAHLGTGDEIFHDGGSSAVCGRWFGQCAGICWRLKRGRRIGPKRSWHRKWQWFDKWRQLSDWRSIGAPAHGKRPSEESRGICSFDLRELSSRAEPGRGGGTHAAAHGCSGGTSRATSEGCWRDQAGAASRKRFRRQVDRSRDETNPTQVARRSGSGVLSRSKSW